MSTLSSSFILYAPLPRGRYQDVNQYRPEEQAPMKTMTSSVSKAAPQIRK